MFNPDGKNMIPDEQEIMDYLILNGGLEVVGIDSENQSFLYSFTPKIKELMPDLYEEHIRTVNSDILALWEKGYVNIDFMSDDPVITITKKSLNDEELSKLSNLIFSLDSVSLDSEDKNLGADEMAQMGITNVDTQIGFVESNYWEGGYNQ
jgi:hypothetical protein